MIYKILKRRLGLNKLWGWDFQKKLRKRAEEHQELSSEEMSEILQMLRSSGWAILRNRLEMKSYLLTQQLVNAKLNEIEKLQGEIKGNQWLLNEIKYIIKKSAQSR